MTHSFFAISNKVVIEMGNIEYFFCFGKGYSVLNQITLFELVVKFNFIIDNNIGILQ